VLCGAFVYGHLVGPAARERFETALHGGIGVALVFLQPEDILEDVGWYGHGKTGLGVRGGTSMWFCDGSIVPDAAGCL
jgi:hypothetical protein